MEKQFCEEDHSRYQRAQEARKDFSEAKSRGKQEAKKDEESQESPVGCGRTAVRLASEDNLTDTREGTNHDKDDEEEEHKKQGNETTEEGPVDHCATNEPAALRHLLL